MKIIRNIRFELNDREEKALSSILDEIRSNGYPNRKGGRVSFEEFLEIEVTDRSIDVLHKPELIEYLGPPSIAGRYGLRINLQCMHEKAREIEFRTAGENQLNALFYPSSTLENETLKHALLYFDNISFVTPERLVINDSFEATPEEDVQTLRGHILGHSIYEIEDEPQALERFYRLMGFRKETRALGHRIVQFYEETLNLRRIGLVHSFPPSNNLSDAFYNAIEQDLNDSSFIEIVRQNNLQPFVIGKSKLLFADVGKDARNRLKRYVLDEDISKSLKHYFKYFNRSLLEPWGFIRVSPELGASILLNHTILTCHKYDLVPFTNNALYQDILLNKFQRISQNKLIADYKKQLRITSSIIALRVMDLHLPRLEFRSFDDVLELKQGMMSELERFRYEMTKFAAEVQATPIDESYEKEIERIIAIKINPAKADIEAKLRGMNRKFAGRVIKGAKAGTVPIVATLFAGVPLPYVLALSAGVITLEALWEDHVERKEITNMNGLSFLFEVTD